VTGSVGTETLKKDTDRSLNDSLGSTAGKEESFLGSKSLPTSDSNKDAGESMVRPGIVYCLGSSMTM